MTTRDTYDIEEAKKLDKQEKEMAEKQVAVGANISFRYTNGIETLHAYVSFGTYDEEKGTDSFGRRDDTIFYYFEDGLGEMLDYIDENHQHTDFTIFDYDVVFTTKKDD